MAGSPEAMAAPQESTKESAEEASGWAQEIVDGCSADLKKATDAEAAVDIVLRGRQHFVSQFYFPGGDVSAAKTPHVLSAAESAAITTQADRLDALMKIVDAKYGSTTSADSKEQLDDIRSKARRGASSSYQQDVEALNR